MSLESTLPTTWEVVPLIELLAALESGSRPKGGVKGIASGIPSLGGEHLDGNGGFRFDNIKYVPENFAKEMARGKLQRGDVLVVKDGATTGKISFVGDGFPFELAVINEHIFLCRCDKAINTKYVFFYLFSNKGNEQILKDFRGAAQGGISQGFADQVKIPLAPGNEQNRIVEKLEELLADLDAGVAELKVAQRKLAQYLQSLLKAAVEGTLTANWRAAHERANVAEGRTPETTANNPPPETGAQLLERILNERRTRWEAKQLAKFQARGKTPPKHWQKNYPVPLKPNTTALPELPEGWVWASLDMLGEIVSGVVKGAKHSSDLVVREVPYLRVANVQRGHLDLTEIKTILATGQDIADLALQDGDVLFNAGGGRDKLGRGWVWRNQVAECIHQNHVFRVRPFSEDIQPELISHHGNTFGKLWFQNAGKQTTNLASINLAILRAFPVPVAPATEQREILEQLRAQLENLTEQEYNIELALRQSSAQRQNILRAAFAGQLVPQNPNDEPTSVLLERIRNERQNTLKNQAKRSRR